MTWMAYCILSSLSPLIWFGIFYTSADHELHMIFFITGFNSHGQLQFHILRLWFWHFYWLWCWCIPVSPLGSVTSYGSDQVHVFWPTTCTRWKQSLVHHLLCIFMDHIHNCRILSDRWSNKERLPHQVQAYDLCRELDLRLTAERSVYFGSSLRDVHHDSERVLLHVLHEIDEPSCQKDQQDNRQCWYGWVCMRDNSKLVWWNLFVVLQVALAVLDLDRFWNRT